MGPVAGITLSTTGLHHVTTASPSRTTILTDIPYDPSDDPWSQGVAQTGHTAARAGEDDLELTGTGFIPDTADDTITVSQSGSTIRLTVDTSARNGRTHHATLTR